MASIGLLGRVYFQWWIHVEINKRSQMKKRGKVDEVDLADPKKSGYVGQPMPPD
jgi:hypothetical protein